MLRKIYISALQPDAGRRLLWITPCKPQAQLGVDMDPIPPLNCEAVQPAMGLRGRDTRTPRVAPGVIHLGRLAASTCSAQKVLCNISN
jgi:hypothetical protein